MYWALPGGLAREWVGALCVSSVSKALLGSNKGMDHHDIRVVGRLVGGNVLFAITATEDTVSTTRLLGSVSVSIPTILVGKIFLFSLGGGGTIACRRVPGSTFFTVARVFIQEGGSPFTFFCNSSKGFAVRCASFGLPVRHSFCRGEGNGFFNRFGGISRCRVLSSVRPIFVDLSSKCSRLGPVCSTTRGVGNIAYSFCTSACAPC